MEARREDGAVMDEADRQIMLADWLKLVEFGEKAELFNAEQNSVVDEKAIARVAGGQTKVPDVKKLADLSDFRFFTAAPVYTHCGVPFDIIGEFRAHMEAQGQPFRGHRVVLKFNNPVLTGMNSEWDYTLEGITTGDDGFENLMKYMHSQRIRKQELGEYWTIGSYNVVVADPMCKDQKTWDPADFDKKALITVFVPSGNKYKVVPHVLKETDPIAFRNYAADQAVINEASAVLKSIG